MYCSNCGRELREGVRFCEFCGTQISTATILHPIEEPEHIPKNPPVQAAPALVEKAPEPVQSTPETADGPKNKKNGRPLLLLATLVAVALAGVFVMLKSNTGASGNNIISDAPRALPELPDMLLFYTGTGYIGDENEEIMGFLVTEEGTMPLEDCQGVQLAEDGTLAKLTGDPGTVQIYRKGEMIGEIPAPVDYFYLSGSGEKIVYGTSDSNSYLWDIAKGKSKLISNEEHSYGISYNGNTLDMGRYTSWNGKRSQMGPSDKIAMSPDGKYIYYIEGTVGVLADGVRSELFPCAAEDYYPYTYMIAHSRDYREALFACGDDIYYSSPKEKGGSEFEAQRITSTNGGMLIALNMMDMSPDGSGSKIAPWYYENSTIFPWIDGGGEPGTGYSFYRYSRSQNSVQNGVYCLLQEQNGMYTASLVKLCGNRLVEIVPNITGNVCLSADETKLWCVADGSLVFCDLTLESPFPVYCNAPDVCAILKEEGVVGAMAPIAATSDGERACFIDENKTLWMCTPETIDCPQIIADDVLLVQCSGDDEFYFLENYSGEICRQIGCGDLYRINTDGLVSYEYAGVADIRMTKSDVYIVVDRIRNSENFALYRKYEGGYDLVWDNLYIFGIFDTSVGICWGFDD